jgi:tetrapyrrole methylase family protein / MazG family protein
MKKTNFAGLVKIMARLRAPGGCPWDREQTHASLLKYLKEEAQEVCEAVKINDFDNLKEELGDVLLQILFHSQIASERKRFTIDDVVDTLAKKLVRRHPHVFGKGKKENLTSEEVKRRWKIMKAKERKGT